MGKIYRHYGDYNPDLVEPIKNRELFSTKPDGGFWVSDIDARWNWEHWCKNEEPEWIDCDYIDFTFKEGTREFIVDSIDKLHELIDRFHLENTPMDDYLGLARYSLLVSKIDFEKIAKEYDALTLVIDNGRELYYGLYGWDCDSTLVLNKNILIELRRKQK